MAEKDHGVPADGGLDDGVVVCSQGCNVTDLVNRLERRMGELSQDWEQVRSKIDLVLECPRSAAGGATSKQIARTLHLSARTIDNHLQHAYTKLGVTGRIELTTALNGSEITAWVAPETPG